MKVVFKKFGDVNQVKNFPVTFSDKADFLISTLVPSKVISIEFILSAEIPGSKPVSLSDSRSVFFIRSQDSKRFTNVLLNKDTKGNFVLQVVGANGERIPKKTLSLYFVFHSY